MSTRRHALFGKRLAAIILAAGLVMAATPSDAPDPFRTDLGHARIAVHRGDDGSLARGSRNEVESSNWSGYAVANFSTGQLYTAAQASWTVPKVSYQTPPPVCHTVTMRGSTRQVCTSAKPSAEYSASWVGIGGYCENANCTAVDNTLIQLGTEHDVASYGATQYYAWIEMLPNYPIVISSPTTYPNCDSLSCAYKVAPGDAMTASLTCESSPCNPGKNQSWLLTMRDRTQNWTFSTTVSYASTLLSAVWIEEAPASSAGTLPLADFVATTFDPTVNGTVNAGLPPNFLPYLADAILMVDPYGEISAPSPAETSPILDAFTTCWGNNPNSIAGCPAP
jgi:Peptidase A4 family